MKTTRLRAQSIYQRIGEAPWGCIRKSWPDIFVVTQPPKSTLRHALMECLMPTNATAYRPDRVLLMGTVEDYMTAGHKVWEKNSSLRRGKTQPLGWFTKKIVDPPLRGPEWQPYVFREVHPPLASRSLFLAAELLLPQSASFAFMDYKIPSRA
jgi:hypothetical protein